MHDNRHGVIVISRSGRQCRERLYRPSLTLACGDTSRMLPIDRGERRLPVARPRGGPSLVGVDLEVLRFDEEHGIFVAGPDLDLPVGSWLRMVPGYAPATVNMYDCYYVVDDDRVIDVWPVFPRGPGHNGLIELP